MGLSFLPRQDDFFELFGKQGDLMVAGSSKFLEMLQNYGEADRLILEIKEIEHQADLVTHDIFDRLNKAFLTPIDPEDIHALAGGMDDVLDEIEGVAARFKMFRVQKPTPEAVHLARILEASSLAVCAAVRGLKDLRKTGRDGILPHLVEINKRENEADEVTRRVVSELFSGEVPILEVIRWKEIYSRLEHAADRAEDVANIIENIIVKNG
jgi:predicted phosphate transport protein (TIGR00153 family)